MYCVYIFIYMRNPSEAAMARQAKVQEQLGGETIYIYI